MDSVHVPVKEPATPSGFGLRVANLQYGRFIPFRHAYIPHNPRVLRLLKNIYDHRLCY